MRVSVFAANWKMHKTVQEGISFVTDFRGEVEGVSDAEIVIAPPFTAVKPVADKCRGTRIGVAGQDLYWESQGAFTGEISAKMLKDAGADYVIIGHSERRQLFGDDDAAVHAKVRAAVGARLTPIVCIGETLDERDAKRTLAVLDRQITGSLRGLTAAEVAALIVAYEPIWAIGTGRTATPDQAQAAHAHIRHRLAETFSDEAASRCRILYGGSVKPSNASGLSVQLDVDGALVGGASLDPGSFAKIVASCRPPTV